MPPIVSTILTGLGAAYGIVTILGNVLPKSWKFTQLLVTFGADLRGVLAELPPPPVKP